MGQRRLGHRQRHRGGDDRRGGKEWYFVTVNFALGQGIEAGPQLHREARRQGAGLRKTSLGTSISPRCCCSADSKQGDRACPMPRRYHQRGEAGLRSRHPARRPDHGGVSCCFGNDVHGMGRKVAQGLQLLEAFSGTWMTTPVRLQSGLSARPGMNGKMRAAIRPASCLALAYLTPWPPAAGDDAKDAVPQMKRFRGRQLFGDVTIRQDGRVIHPMYLSRSRSPRSQISV